MPIIIYKPARKGFYSQNIIAFYSDWKGAAGFGTFKKI